MSDVEIECQNHANCGDYCETEREIAMVLCEDCLDSYDMRERERVELKTLRARVSELERKLEDHVLLPRRCPSWLEDAYDARCKADGHYDPGLYLPAYDAMVQALESQRTTVAGIEIVENPAVPDDCIRVIITPDASADDIPDFIAGNGNKARRRALAMGVTRWVPVPAPVDSEGGHCD